MEKPGILKLNSQTLRGMGISHREICSGTYINEGRLWSSGIDEKLSCSRRLKQSRTINVPFLATLHDWQMFCSQSDAQQGGSFSRKSQEWVREIAQKSLAKVTEWRWWRWVKRNGGHLHQKKTKQALKHKCKVWVNNESAKQAGKDLATVGGCASQNGLVQGRNFLPVFINRYRWLGCLFFWGEKTQIDRMSRDKIFPDFTKSWH